MDRSERLRLWKSIEADLLRAEGSLGEEGSDDPIIKQFREFLEHNELELACSALADYGEIHPAAAEFWIALRDAANKMQLPDRVEAYERYAEAVRNATA
jgi:hypothetical protein